MSFLQIDKYQQTINEQTPTMGGGSLLNKESLV